ncbi:MAG: hypothetical protein JRN06_02880 [Nitrososphaerota archaeon]|nr:hypothetical protein [Nitrososphaerota archaeon]MDG7023198.1 hypothetical protein [Nitrososphaerota archaeon]
MQTESPRKPWYTRPKYIILIAVLAVLLLFSLYPVGPSGPKPKSQVALDSAITYFANNYNFTLGLIPETPGSHVYWLVSDNYLADLALTRYSSSNQSTANFGAALSTALSGYEATLPAVLRQSQYSALNSTKAYFGCSADYALSWSTGGVAAGGNGSAVLMTTANDQGPACASQNYADLLFLQAIYSHRLGDSTAAASYYQTGAKDFDGKGFVDLANQGSAQGTLTYQTYKVALYVYATICLGEQANAPNLAAAESTLLHMQSNSTGGFATSYGSGITPTSGANTETTALAALALELMISPSSSC